MNIDQSLARKQRSMDLDKQLMTVMMTITAGRFDSALIESIEMLVAEYEELLEATEPDEKLITGQMLREKLAAVRDWYARALEGAGRVHDAVEAFELAASMFDEVGKRSQAQRSRDKAGELRLEINADFDQEIQRLRDRLEKAQPKSLDRVQILIQLGELHSKANDDFEAGRYLELAEKELAELGGHPSDADLLADLGRTVAAIGAEETVAGASAIESGVQRRALTQRLLLALGNVYRVTNPARAGEYERRLRELDDGKNSNLRDLMGRYLDSGGDIASFLANFPKK